MRRGPGSIPSAINVFVERLRRGEVAPYVVAEFMYIVLSMLNLSDKVSPDENTLIRLANEVARAYKEGRVNDYTIKSFIISLIANSGITQYLW